LCQHDAVIRFKATPADLDYLDKLKKNDTAAEEATGDDAMEKQLDQVYESWFPHMQTVVHIQKLWRSYSVHSSLVLVVSAMIQIQATFRRHLSMISFRDKLVAAVRIQTFVRRALTRLERSWLNELVAIKEHAAAIRLQRSWRMSSATFAYLSLKDCVVLIQATFHGYNCRHHQMHIYNQVLAVEAAILMVQT